MHEKLPKDQQRQIKSFVDAAFEFNKTHNIFSRKTKEEVYEKDVLECLSLKTHTGEQNHFRHRLGRRLPGCYIVYNETKKHH